MYNLEEIVRFKSAVSTAQSINLRPDFWIFPFLNVYGIFAKAKTSTAIDAGLWLPDTANNWNEIAAFSSKADFDAVTTGFGMTPTVGVAGCFLALDMNMAWTSISAIEKPVFSFVFGPRLGKSFKFKNPDRNISIWAGGFRVSMSSETNGSLNLAEVLPVDEMQGKVDEGMLSLADPTADFAAVDENSRTRHRSEKITGRDAGGQVPRRAPSDTREKDQIAGGRSRLAGTQGALAEDETASPEQTQNHRKCSAEKGRTFIVTSHNHSR